MKAAFFDVDATLVAATAVHYWFFFARRWHKGWRLFLLYLSVPLRVIVYYVVDLISRTAFNHLMYYSYKGVSIEWIKSNVDECFEKEMKPKLMPVSCKLLKMHLDRGDRVIIVSGSTDIVIEPLMRYLNVQESIAPGFEVKDGVCTGKLTCKPVVDQNKADMVVEFAKKNGINLEESYCYGDSMSDLPMLETVGHPRIVGKEIKIKKIARKRGWEIME